MNDYCCQRKDNNNTENDNNREWQYSNSFYIFYVYLIYLLYTEHTCVCYAYILVCDMDRIMSVITKFKYRRPRAASELWTK